MAPHLCRCPGKRGAPCLKNTKSSKVSGYLDAQTWDALRAAGYTDEQLAEDTGQIGPVIFAYTRAQAIADGVLVDVTALARRGGSPSIPS